MNEATSRPTRTAPPPTDEAVYTEAPATNLPARAEPVQDVKPAATVSARTEEAEPELPASGPGAVIAGIAAIMAEIKPIEKAGWNKFHQYAHVRMQDLSRELTPLMGKHGIVVFQNEVGRELFDNGNVVAVRYHFTVVHKSGAIWPQRTLQTGVSTCRNTKSGFDDKALNKAHTAARKYFLISLFQLASEDSEDGDNEATPQSQGGQQRPRSRPVPSPTGKFAPHKVPVMFDDTTGENETPAKWAKRFLEFVIKADSKGEIDEWYGQNERLLLLIKERGDATYDDVIAAMDAREADLIAPEKAKDAPKPTTTATADGFPGDKQAKPAGDPGDIPAALKRRRTAPPPEVKPTLTDEEREWIEGLQLAFESEDDREGLDNAFVRLLEPHVTKFTALAVDKANELYNTNCDRIDGKL